MIYETAERTCQRAFDGHVPLKVARDAFAAFAPSEKFLEDVSTAGAKAGQTRDVAA